MSLQEMINRAFDTPLVDAEVQNSPMFDKKSYEADGGDDWIHSKRELFFDRDKAKDKSLWDRAAQVSRDIFGKINWKFIVWKYRKQGGEF